MTEPFSLFPATPATGALFRAEAAALAPELSGLAGAYGLQIDLGPPSTLPRTPMLSAWARLSWDGSGYAGSLRARADESLPFVDDVFRVVVLSHVLEHLPHADEVLAEATRVLAPDGLLAITGFHPLGAWWPWLMWHLRSGHRGSLSVVAPVWLRPRLVRRDVSVYAVRRFGSVWPSRHAPAPTATAIGGCYLLLGRKRRHAVTPLRPRRARARASAPATLAPGVHRECA